MWYVAPIIIFLINQYNKHQFDGEHFLLMSKSPLVIFGTGWRPTGLGLRTCVSFSPLS